jgi:acetyl esterase/lipase
MPYYSSRRFLLSQACFFFSPGAWRIFRRLVVAMRIALLVCCWYLILSISNAFFIPLNQRGCAGVLYYYTSARNAVQNTAVATNENEKNKEEEEEEEALAFFASLPPPPPSNTNPSDDIFRWMRQNLSVELLNWMRDSGLARSLMDGLVIIVGLPAIVKSYPQALPNFLKLTWDTHHQYGFSTLQYGPNRLQTLDLFQSSTNHNNNRNNHHWIVICHGGAWGSGRPWMYRLAALPFLQAGYNKVAIWGYRTYPDGNAQQQMEDLRQALVVLRRNNNNNGDNDNNTDHDDDHKKQLSITIVAHSSGAHVALLTAMEHYETHIDDDNNFCDGMVLLSGVYDVPKHYEWETGRGVEEISAMAPACGNNVEEWIRYSPTRRVTADSNLLLGRCCCLPPMLILHGQDDKVVPYTSALEFTQAYLSSTSATTKDCKLEIMPVVEHADTVLHLMMGGITSDLVMEWLEERRQ